MATTFFSLSLEIRDEIYSYLWADVSTINVREDANIAVRAILPWSGSNRALLPLIRSKRGYPTWIYTSQDFFKEAIACLHRVSVFDLSILKPNWDADDSLDLFDPQTLWPCSARQICTLRIEHMYQVEETWINKPVEDEKDKARPYWPSLETPFNDAPKAPKVQITSLAFLCNLFTTMSSTISSLRDLTIKIKPAPESDWETFDITSARADDNQDILNLREAAAPILPQLRRFEIYICTYQLVGWKFSRSYISVGRKSYRDAAIDAIQAWADAQIEQANALGMGGLVTGEATRMTESWQGSDWVMAWKVVWVHGQSEDDEGA
ncbi:hypothetical protein BKA63DRAFT_492450 [Paraphoma chrysanthemicola]|nr:hypothetical protein BKA63DRAFT_492450 [Paraphoma chrysanthemicola]